VTSSKQTDVTSLRHVTYSVTSASPFSCPTDIRRTSRDEESDIRLLRTYVTKSFCYLKTYTKSTPSAKHTQMSRGAFKLNIFDEKIKN